MSRLDALKDWLASWFKDVDLNYGPELRKALDPLLKSWGFEPIKPGKPEWHGTQFDFLWRRKRGEYTDEIYVRRRRKAPDRYGVSLRTDQLVRMLGPRATPPTARLSDMEMRMRELHPNYGDDFRWTEPRMPLKPLLKLLRSRLEEAEAYLQTGVRTRNIRLAIGDPFSTDPDGADIPVFWFRLPNYPAVLYRKAGDPPDDEADAPR